MNFLCINNKIIIDESTEKIIDKTYISQNNKKPTVQILNRLPSSESID